MLRAIGSCCFFIDKACNVLTLELVTISLRRWRVAVSRHVAVPRRSLACPSQCYRPSPPCAQAGGGISHIGSSGRSVHACRWGGGGGGVVLGSGSSSNSSERTTSQHGTSARVPHTGGGGGGPSPPMAVDALSRVLFSPSRARATRNGPSPLLRGRRRHRVLGAARNLALNLVGQCCSCQCIVDTFCRVRTFGQHSPGFAKAYFGFVLCIGAFSDEVFKGNAHTLSE